MNYSEACINSIDMVNFAIECMKTNDFESKFIIKELFDEMFDTLFFEKTTVTEKEFLIWSKEYFDTRVKMCDRATI